MIKAGWLARSTACFPGEIGDPHRTRRRLRLTNRNFRAARPTGSGDRILQQLVAIVTPYSFNDAMIKSGIPLPSGAQQTS
jgi:hypothetical protein